MKRLFSLALSGLLLLSWSGAQAEDALLMLANGGSTTQTPETKLFSKHMSGTPAEKNIFLQFVGKKEWKKALYQWSAATKSQFRETPAGQALYGVLLLKNRMELAGLETITTISPQSLPKDMWSMLTPLLSAQEEEWLYVSTPWSKSWSGHLSQEAQVLWRSHSLSQNASAQQLSQMLGQVKKGGRAYQWLLWQSALADIITGDNASASGKLSALLKSNSSLISKDLLNMTAARILFEEGFLQASKGYYDQVSGQSDFWMESVEENAWQFMRLGKTKEARQALKPLLKSDRLSTANSEFWYLKALAELREKDLKSLEATGAEFKSHSKRRVKHLRKLIGSADVPAVRTYLKRSMKSPLNLMQLKGLSVELPTAITKDVLMGFQVEAYKRFTGEAAVAKSLYQESLSQGTSYVGFVGALKEMQQQAQDRALHARSLALDRVQKLAKQEMDEIESISKKLDVVEVEVTQMSIN